MKLKILPKKALLLGESINADKGIAHAHSVLGSLYSAQHKYQQSLREHGQSLAIRKRLGYRYGISQSLYNIATVYERMGQTNKAIDYAKQTLEIDEALGNLYNYGLTHKKLANLYVEKKAFDLAQFHLNIADSCARRAVSLELRRDVDLSRAELLEKKGDLKAANEYLRRAFKVNDSMFNVASLQEIAEIRGVFDLENIEIKSRQKEQKIELQQAALQNQRNQIVLGVVILVLVSIMLGVSISFYYSSRAKNQALSVEIAEREKAEQELERLFQDLEQKNAELELASRYKSEFLANMSHELRTPLNSILILARVLQDNKMQNLSPKQVEYANVIHKSGSDLLRLINDVLDLAKVEAGKMELQIASHEIKEFINSLKMSFMPIVQDKLIDFQVEISNEVPRYFYTDIDRLEQIVRNLLSNAFKFTPIKGQVQLRLQTIHSHPLITSEAEVLEISVRDTGIGIPKENQKQVFMAFQQGDGSTQRKYGGTGLGLSISKEFAKLLGGDILLESEEGKGAIFSLLLPLRDLHLLSYEGMGFHSQ